MCMITQTGIHALNDEPIAFVAQITTWGLGQSNSACGYEQGPGDSQATWRLAGEVRCTLPEFHGGD